MEPVCYCYTTPHGWTRCQGKQAPKHLARERVGPPYSSDVAPRRAHLCGFPGRTGAGVSTPRACEHYTITAGGCQDTRNCIRE